MKNAARVVENWINRDIADLCFHTSQNPNEIQLTLTGDHFGNTYGFYVGRVNTFEPNSPSNFIPLASISNTQDCEEIIFRIIEPIINEICSLTTIKLDFSPCIGLPRQPPEQIEIPQDDFPTHHFGSRTKLRGPENLLCYQPGEIKNASTTEIKMCETCSRKFENEDSLQMHNKIDHEDLNKRNKLRDIHPDFYFYSNRKGMKIPKTQYIAAFDDLIINPRYK